MKLLLTPLAVVAIALWLPLFLLIASLQGCQPRTTGLLRPVSAGVEHAFTNVVPTVTAAAAAVLPAPFSGAVQATAAAVLALLAAWQGFTHERIKKLTAQTAQSVQPPKL